MVDLSVVVPVRNAEDMLDECLRSITEADPSELIIVDGCSTDRTVDIARRYGAQVLSDEGKGLPVARLLGARAATSNRVALIDADVVLPKGSLAALLEEFEREGYVALQAGLQSVSGPGYWGRALAHHHRTGRSKNWFGLVATIFDRDALLELGFDARFVSGEDIELRWRLRRAGVSVGVSSETVVQHRFGDSFAFARGQFLADGHGLARMIIMKRAWRSLVLIGLPGAAAVRGIALSIVHLEPAWIPYYLAFGAYNYLAMFEEFVDQLRSRRTRARMLSEEGGSR
jgi:glycosyltransferase involved in cell wall biosynthesis